MEQREVDNMLLSMIQKHFPSLPLSDEHTDWGKWLGFARAVYEAGRASPASAPELREQVEKLTDECVVLRASSRSKLETISSLELQVEKLTKERDTLKTMPMKYRRMQFNAELQEDVRQQEQQLAALAEQNEKLRKVLLRLACLGNGDQYGNSIGNCIAQEALSLPDLASPVLNRIRAEENEAIIAAANALENIASTSSSTRIRRVANDALTAIRARRK